jgi:hypothetical protein
MNRKQFVILLVFVILLGGAGLVLHRRESASWTPVNSAAGRKLLGNFPVNDVTRIAILQGSNQVNLVKQNDQWRVREREGYPASFPRISEFLLKARDLKIVQSDRVGASQWARLDLAPGQGAHSAQTVEFIGQNDKPIQTLLLGKQHLRKPAGAAQSDGVDAGWPDGRYVRVGDSDHVALISDPLENADPKPDAWLDKDFVKVQKARTIEVSFPNATNSWKLTRESESGDWKLADAKAGEELDKEKIIGLSNPLSSPSFLDVTASGQPGAAGATAPTVVKIATFDDFDYTFRIGAKTNEDYPVTVAVTAQIPTARKVGKDEKPADQARLDKEFKEQRQKLEDKLKQEQAYGRWTYLVESWSLDPVLKDRWQLLEEKKAEKQTAQKGAAEPASKDGQTGKELPTVAARGDTDGSKTALTNSPPSTAN